MAFGNKTEEHTLDCKTCQLIFRIEGDAKLVAYTALEGSWTRRLLFKENGVEQELAGWVDAQKILRGKMDEIQALFENQSEEDVIWFISSVEKNLGRGISDHPLYHFLDEAGCPIPYSDLMPRISEHAFVWYAHHLSEEGRHIVRHCWDFETGEFLHKEVAAW